MYHSIALLLQTHAAEGQSSLSLQDLVLAVLVEREPIKLAPNSAQIPTLLAKTKQNIYQMRQAMGPPPSASAAAAAGAAAPAGQGNAEANNANAAQTQVLSMIIPDDGLHARIQTAVRSILEALAETWANHPSQIHICGTSNV